MKIKVLQINSDRDEGFVRFEGYDYVIREAGKVDPKIYDVVYDGDAPVADVEDVYYMLNVGVRPEGYTGHSLSVSDVVEIDGKYMFCDSFGWKDVTEEWKCNEEKKAEAKIGLRFVEGGLHRDDWKTYKWVCRVIENILIEGHGGTIRDGVSYVDVGVNASKEEVEQAIEFLRDVLPYCPPNCEMYGE